MGGRLCDDSGTSLRFRIGIALAVVAFAGTASAASAPTIRLYGLVFPAHGNPEPMSLARLDPSTLAPVGQPTLLGQFIGFAVLSPDARRVAVVEPRSAVIRLYEDVALRSRLVLGSGDEQVRDVVWTSPDRFVAIVQRMSRPYARYVRARYAVGVDAARGRVLFRTRFGQRLALMSTATSHGSAALLFESSNLLARHARLTVVSATGTVRSVTLRFGAVRTTRLLAAALAVDAGSSRAYVVLSGGRVAVIDLRTLRVAYHVVHPLPHESTATDWVTFRAARFGRHFLVVSGLIVGGEPRDRPAGIAVIDTRTWRGRLLDRSATGFGVVGDTVITSGKGITAYGEDGARRYHLIGSTTVSALAIIEGRGHAWIGPSRPFALGPPPPTQIVIFGPQSGVVFARANISGPVRVSLLDPAGY